MENNRAIRAISPNKVITGVCHCGHTVEMHQTITSDCLFGWPELTPGIAYKANDRRCQCLRYREIQE